MTDEAIIEKVINGNTHIFSEIVLKYKDRVFNMAYGYTNDYSDAQDVSQEVFIIIFKKLHLFSFKSKFSTWLYQVAANACIDWTRKNKKRIRKTIYSEADNELADDGLNIEENFIKRQSEALLRKEILVLDEKYKTILILHHFQELSYEEIGEVLGVPYKTVETRLYRARIKLRNKLTRHYLGGEKDELQTNF